MNYSGIRSDRRQSISHISRFLVTSVIMWIALIPGRVHSQLQFKYGGTTVLSISNSGICTFQDGYREQSEIALASGELNVGFGAEHLMWTNTETSDRRINLKNRFIANGVVPTSGLLFDYGTTAVAAVTNDGDLYAKGDYSTSLPDPTVSGTNSFTSVVYASTGVQHIPVYNLPTPGYETPRLDVSMFHSSLAVSWGFDATSVPINGLLTIPDGSGSFPLVLFVHGNHNPEDFSEPGYVYLCELLASRGIIAGTIDMNFLNGAIWGENGARAIVFLEHIKQFKIWNEQMGHPLFDKVDMDNIMIVGHSRGGEAVGHASYINTLDEIVPHAGDPIVALDGTEDLGPYHFSIKGVFAFGPVDNQYIPVTGPTVINDNYFVIQGGRSGDVSDFLGHATFARAQPIDPADPTAPAGGFKALCYFYGGNHTYFNQVWGDDGSPTVTRAEQEQIGKIYIMSFAMGVLKGYSQYLEILKSHNNAVAWLPVSTPYISQFQDKERLFLNHYEEDAVLSTISPPTTGSNTFSSATVTEPEIPYTTSSLPLPVNHAMQLVWNTVNGTYNTILSNPIAAGSFSHLVVHANPDDDPLNGGLSQILSITMEDADGVVGNIVTSAYTELPYPNINRPNDFVLQTIRIPLSAFANQGVDISRINEVTLRTDQRSTGSCHFDELQLSY